MLMRNAQTFSNFKVRWFVQYRVAFHAILNRDLSSYLGEFLLRLRQLEKSLLQALNEVKGRILDDDRSAHTGNRELDWI